jgi:DNA-binding beta-propeller fold protein YncE
VIDLNIKRYRYGLVSRIGSHTLSRIVAVVVLVLTGNLAACLGAPHGMATLPQVRTSEKVGLRLVQTIPLPNVAGRIDHLSIDMQGQRLFVAALENNTVEVLKLSTGKPIHIISGLSAPQGVLFVPALNEIYVSNGANGVCAIFNGDSFTLIDQIELSSDADNLRYDRRTASVYVGYGNGGLSLVDAATNQAVGHITLDGHPESFQLERRGPRIFINIPSANQIAVIDRVKRRVMTSWPLKNASANYPMALDEIQHRLFVGFRRPARLGVYNTESGRLIASLDSAGDADDIFYDAVLKRIYVIGGEGFIDIFAQQDADHYRLLTQIPTATGARTGLLVPETDRLYVAVPHYGRQRAEVRVYELQP